MILGSKLGMGRVIMGFLSRDRVEPGPLDLILLLTESVLPGPQWVLADCTKVAKSHLHTTLNKSRDEKLIER